MQWRNNQVRILPQGLSKQFQQQIESCHQMNSYLQTPVTPVKITSPQGTRHCAESPNHSIPNTQFEINEIMTSAPKNFTAK